MFLDVKQAPWSIPLRWENIPCIVLAQPTLCIGRNTYVYSIVFIYDCISYHGCAPCLPAGRYQLSYLGLLAFSRTPCRHHFSDISLLPEPPTECHVSRCKTSAMVDTPSLRKHTLHCARATDTVHREKYLRIFYRFYLRLHKLPWMCSLPAGRQVPTELYWPTSFFKNSLSTPLFRYFSLARASDRVPCFSM